MEVGREPQRMRWNQEKNHRELDGIRKRTIEIEMEVGKESPRMVWREGKNHRER
jgi:hypothetical protein